MTESKRAILAATQEILRTEGYHGLTTARVATAADVSQSLVHHYFETKSELLVAFLEYYRKQVSTLLGKIESRTPADRLPVVLCILAGNTGDPEARGLALAIREIEAALGRDPAYQDAVAGYRRELLSFLAGTVEEGIERGTFRQCDPEATARLILCAVDGALLAEYTGGAGAVEAVVFDALLEFVLTDLYVSGSPDLDKHRGQIAVAGFGDTSVEPPS